MGTNDSAISARLCPLNPKGDCKTYFSALFQAFDWFPFCNSPIKGQSLVIQPLSLEQEIVDDVASILELLSCLLPRPLC